MVTTTPTVSIHLWEYEKIPSSRSAGYHDDWWTTRERIFWTEYEEGGI